MTEARAPKKAWGDGRSDALFGHSLARELVIVGLFYAVFFACYFAPVWMHGVILSPGDASISYFPFFHKPWALISDQLLLGYPVGSDLQVQANYLPKLLLPNYNAFVISAYVIMALGTYAFVSGYVGSRLGALFAGMIAGGSGFMMGHLGHATIIHSASWIPWILWGFHLCSQRANWGGVCVGAFAVAMSLLGGHPQITIIGLGLAFIFWIFLVALAAFERHSWRALVANGLAIFILGFMLSAISVLPFAELVRQGVRAGWSIADFNTYSETTRTLLLGLFPGLLGTFPNTIYGAYSGPWNMTELVFYAGLVPVMLAAVAIVSDLRRPHVVFWISVAVLALVASLGALTPVGEIIYHMPVLGTFRAQGRYGIVYILAVSVLAAVAVEGIRHGRFGTSQVLRGIALTLSAFILCLVVIARIYRSLPAPAGYQDGSVLASMLHNPAIYIPSALLLTGAVLLIFWAKSGRSALAFTILVLVSLDLATFGQFYEWRFVGLSPEAMEISSQTRAQIEAVRASGTRVLPVVSSLVTFSPFSPQSNILFDVPLAVNYGPLLSRRFNYFAAMDTTGHPDFDVSRSPLLDILGVGWLSRTPGGPMFEEALLSRECGGNTGEPYRVTYHFPEGTHGVRLRIISHMACSVDIDQGATVAELTWTGDGVDHRLPLRAGIDTSEWAIDRPGLLVHHGRAPVAFSFDAPEAPGHYYVSEKALSDGKDVSIGAISIQMAPSHDFAIRIHKVELLDAAGHIVPVEPEQPGLTIDKSNPAVTLARRQVQPPLQWSVCVVRALAEEPMRTALTSGALPDGGRFEPHTLALLDADATFASPTCRAPAIVKVQERSSSRIRVLVVGAGSSMLVISQAFYPGWDARIDGKKAAIVPIDGVIQGVMVPNGEHVIELNFVPRSFVLGCAVTLLAIFILLITPLWRRRQRRLSKGIR